MNMLALTWGDTTIVVDAGVMFPDPELLGVDLIIPDLTYLQQKGRRRRARADARPRGSHRRRAARAAAHRRPGLRHAADAGAGRAEARGARHRRHGAAASPCGRATASRSARSTIEFIRVTHSMPDCVALAIHTPAGVDRPHRRLQDRPDAARRRALRPAPLRASSAPQGVLALFADSTNIDRRGFTGSGARGHRRVRGDLHQRARASSSSRRSRRASTGCRSSSTSRRSSTARSRSSAAA